MKNLRRSENMNENEIRLLAKEVIKEEAKLVMACLKVFNGTKVSSEAKQIATILGDYVERK
jgi:hypothetical protein